ncbi:hypothetical protein APHAL10511_003851 [Amanita phalloides]|nr:hypothetical protein APHAL10511_003851 [Amanita phalloides]
MASKQLGKLRQWAGEVISSREKTSLSGDVKELERDIEFRREGARRLYLATETYHRSLSKKKLNEALDEAEQLLPMDALGVVMIVHGEEYEDDSVFGSSLLKLGRAHCKIATLQEAFALTLRDTFMSYLLRFGEEIKEYDGIRKKLESKRHTYDAAIAKAEKYKNSKKEKDRREAEEELERAQYRYEETMEDVRAHMHAIQDNETTQHRELTGLLDLEIGYVQQYLAVLMDVKAEWQTKSNNTRRRNSVRSTNARPQKQAKYSSLRVPPSARAGTAPGQDFSDEEDFSGSSEKHSVSIRRKSEAEYRPPSLPNSRSGSRAPSYMSRKRSDSSTTIGERDRESEKDKADKPKRLSVAGWASSAVGSVTSLGRKSRDKDRFSELPDDSDDHDDHDNSSPLLQSNSFHSTEKRCLTKHNKQRKIVRAVKDFEGSPDELSFNTGDEIIVINEVLDEWWLGLLNNKTGLFPTAYVEALPGKPRIPEQWLQTEEADLEDDKARALPGDTYGSDTGDLDEYGRLSRQQPISEHRSPFFTGPSDVVSITSSGHEDEEANLMPKKNRAEDVDDSRWGHAGPPPPPMRRSTTTDIRTLLGPASLSTSSPKKPTLPPPPPPRRSSTIPSLTPPIPERKLHILHPTASTSTVSSLEDGKQGYDRSPFESASELANTGAPAPTDQNPF